jgi:hypothetical protein
MAADDDTLFAEDIVQLNRNALIVAATLGRRVGAVDR